ncbi:NRDE family protein [Marinobacterium lutimaris]|uniref:Uncharacterized conserved protein, contains NRDE domain n=1 Tax=Marinobacterium lutimaris TaxID=568106 RepID=A0A1H6CX90_9GAMM|nr:NRDE family protein [Marinobacterium lutimaris]SEG77749.1 Uncharacterized conserved protein, contains NRDE domain [Marinobacterium lutimaris]
MCLIVFALNADPDWPFLLLANRDEFHARPTRSLHYWPDAPVIAGRDLRANGSWMGLSRDGRFAALTNYRDGREPLQQGASRGQLVTDFLCGDRPASDYLPSTEVRSGYNLLWADDGGFFYGSNRGGNVKRLDTGIHSLSNALLDTPWPKTRRARQALEQALGTGKTAPSELIELLHDDIRAADDQLPDTGIPFDKEQLLSSCFIHSEDYGTRASTLIMQNSAGDTRIIERRYDRHGEQSGETDLSLRLKPLGISPQ